MDTFSLFQQIEEFEPIDYLTPEELDAIYEELSKMED